MGGDGWWGITPLCECRWEEMLARFGRERQVPTSEMLPWDSGASRGYQALVLGPALLVALSPAKPHMSDTPVAHICTGASTLSYEWSQKSPMGTQSRGAR